MKSDKWYHFDYVSFPKVYVYACFRIFRLLLKYHISEHDRHYIEKYNMLTHLTDSKTIVVIVTNHCS